VWPNRANCVPEQPVIRRVIHLGVRTKWGRTGHIVFVLVEIHRLLLEVGGHCNSAVTLLALTAHPSFLQSSICQRLQELI
jgi:hypothetical protein